MGAAFPAMLTFLALMPAWVIGGCWAAAALTGGASMRRVKRLAMGAASGLFVPTALMAAVSLIASSGAAQAEPLRSVERGSSPLWYLALAVLVLCSTVFGASVGQLRFRQAESLSQSRIIPRASLIAIGVTLALLPPVAVGVLAVLDRNSRQAEVEARFDSLGFDFMVPAFVPARLTRPPEFLARVTDAGSYAQIEYGQSEGPDPSKFSSIHILEKDLETANPRRDEVCAYLTEFYLGTGEACTKTVTPAGHELHVIVAGSGGSAIVLFEKTSVTITYDNLDSADLAKVVDSMRATDPRSIEGLTISNFMGLELPRGLF